MVFPLTKNVYREWKGQIPIVPKKIFLEFRKKITISTLLLGTVWPGVGRREWRLMPNDGGDLPDRGKTNIEVI